MRRWYRSKYEKIIHKVIAREPMRIGQKRYRVDRVNGWYQVEFREGGSRRRRTFNLDELVQMSAAKRPASVRLRKPTPAKKRHAMKLQECTEAFRGHVNPDCWEA